MDGGVDAASNTATLEQLRQSLGDVFGTGQITDGATPPCSNEFRTTARGPGSLKKTGKARRAAPILPGPSDVFLRRVLLLQWCPNAWTAPKFSFTMSVPCYVHVAVGDFHKQEAGAHYVAGLAIPSVD